ncbi:MAG: hypothetical protein H7Z13_10730 [Ferruginibacter sp.]|nr:hypothetical protein [Ferruginibacter sp.]
MQKLLSIFLVTALYFFCGEITAQAKKDSITAPAKKIADSSDIKKTKKFDPRKATRRSAILPGWGQIYNKKYWKLPLVYGGLGITAGVFVYNVKNYKLLRLAYIYKIDTDTTNDALIDPRFKNLSSGALRSYRNTFRQNVDYSVLFFIVFWGLNVIDATVDGHLKEFDVNDNLSLQLKQGYSPMANTSGISLVLDIHSKKTKAGK